MAEKERVPVGCSVCNRIMWPEGVDDAGRCPDCQPAATKPEPAAAKPKTESEPSE